jgi:hypothetical protein
VPLNAKPAMALLGFNVTIISWNERILENKGGQTGLFLAF